MTLSDYEVRHPTLADTDSLGEAHVQIWREAYAGLMPQQVLDALDPVKRAKRWRDILTAPGGTERNWVAIERATGKAVGMVTVDESRDDDPPTPMELWAINLLAAHHGTGLGQALLDHALGDQDAHLWVVEGNERAIAFYRRNGFVDDGGRKRDEDLGVDEIRMTRKSA